MKATKFNTGMMIAVNGRVKVNQNVTAALGKQMTLKQAITHAKQLARSFVSATDFVAIDIFADNHHVATVEAWKDGRKVSFDVHEIAGIIKVDEAETPATPETETATNTETTMTTTDTNNVTTANTLTLGKCAYIFHWSNSNYFYGTAAQRAEKAAQRKALQTIYDNPDKGVNLPYTVNASGHVLVEVDGLDIAVTDKMIANVSGTHPRQNIINNRAFKSLRSFYDSFKPGTFAAFWQYNDYEYFFGGSKMKSFEIESFPGVNNLNYYRVHFRRNRLDFITANGKVYAAGGDNYSELTPVDIINTLQAESNSARKIILALFDYLTA